eukprot:gene29539-35656_t
MSTLASQKQLADLTNKFEGRIPIRVHFLDNSSKVFLVSEYASVKDLLTLCLEKLSVADPSVILPYYGIFESRNGASIDAHLPLDSLLQDAIRQWSDLKVDKTAKFLCMIRLYMPSIWGLTNKDDVMRSTGTGNDMSMETYLEHAEVVDEHALHLQFIQAVYHIITGKYPTTEETALTLGAYHFLTKFGEYKSDRHVAGFLGNRVAEFVPIKLLKGSKGATASLEEWESKLYASVQKVMEDVVVQNNKLDNISTLFLRKASGAYVSLARAYMEIVYGMEVYGISLYKVTQKNVRVLPESLLVGVGCEGLVLFDKNKKFLKRYYIEDILRWGFKPNQSFFFELPEDINDLGASNVEFDTQEGKVISDLLTDYALAFLKEKEREEERARNPTATPAAAQNRAKATNGHAGGKTWSAADKLRAAVKIQALYRGF